MKSKILIIEDDDDTSDMLTVIADQLDLNVVTSTEILSISEILSIAPNLILLDHWVGIQLGSKLCLDLKSDTRTQHIPIIIMSAVPNIDRIATDSCANAYFEKPFEVNTVIKLIAKFIPAKH